jgi:dGTP triphosphohydrolase
MKLEITLSILSELKNRSKTFSLLYYTNNALNLINQHKKEANNSNRKDKNMSNIYNIYIISKLYAEFYKSGLIHHS